MRLYLFIPTKKDFLRIISVKRNEICDKMNIKWNTFIIRKPTAIQNKTTRKKEFFGQNYNFINWRSDNTITTYPDLWSIT